MNLKKMLEGIEEELAQPMPDPQDPPTTTKRKRKMAKKTSKKKTSVSAEERTTKKKVSKKKLAVKKEPKKAKSAESDEDYVTVSQLALEAEIGPQTARVKLREAAVDRDGEKRWRWKRGSKALKSARKALGLD